MENRQRILVVEDESAVVDPIVYVLRAEGFDPAWAATGGEARRSLAEGGVALVILDVGLPDVSGFELCKEIRKGSDVPVIFLTSRVGEIDRVLGLEIGGDDYVVKPFSPRELAARVKAVLRRRGAGTPPPPAMGRPSAFSVEPERCRILYHGVPLNLSRYEYRLLKTLVGRPGRVFTRDELMAVAWDAPEMSTDRTVDTHVKTLRAKLKEVRPDEDPVVTHRGFGYSLKDDA
ncbi:MAG: two-component system response regulator CreB [Acidobacteria bacterium]|nr:two-component system response regulator CreB [Acidobacteriota bacterium]